MYMYYGIFHVLHHCSRYKQATKSHWLQASRYDHKKEKKKISQMIIITLHVPFLENTCAVGTDQLL